MDSTNREQQKQILKNYDRNTASTQQVPSSQVIAVNLESSRSAERGGREHKKKNSAYCGGVAQ